MHQAITFNIDTPLVDVNDTDQLLLSNPNLCLNKDYDLVIEQAVKEVSWLGRVNLAILAD